MNLLKELNLKPGIIYETICGTYNPDGTPNLAPMGVRLGQGLILFPYVTTQTSKNIKITRACSINFSDNAWIFTWACINGAEEKKMLMQCLRSGRKINCPVLYDAIALVECQIDRIETSQDKTRDLVFCKPVYVEVKRKFVPYTRAFSLLIEMLIHASRIRPFEALEDQNKVFMLKKEIKKYAQIIQRVASTEYPAIVDYILKKVGLENAGES
ncbi:MAG: DUF447 domain-containing protein [Candidatus Heimdallarchaeota archaeon]